MFIIIDSMMNKIKRSIVIVNNMKQKTEEGLTDSKQKISKRQRVCLTLLLSLVSFICILFLKFIFFCYLSK